MKVRIPQIYWWGYNLAFTFFTGSVSPFLGAFGACAVTLFCMWELKWGLWDDLLTATDERASFRGWVNIILGGLHFIWLVPGLTVSFWLPWLASLMRQLA